MYALIHKHEIQVGPRTWSYVFFKDYLDEEGLDATNLPRQDPRSVVAGKEWKIVPVEVTVPYYDVIFQRLSGPNLTIGGDRVTGYYNIIDNDVTSAQIALKNIVTSKRYQIEVGGCPFTFQDGTQVTLYTSREDRSAYLDAYQIIPEDGTIVFKFPGEFFKTVTKVELGNIVTVGAGHIASAFAWEADLHNQINSCTSLEQLRQLNIRHPSEM